MTRAESTRHWYCRERHRESTRYLICPVLMPLEVGTTDAMSLGKRQEHSSRPTKEDTSSNTIFDPSIASATQRHNFLCNVLKFLPRLGTGSLQRLSLNLIFQYSFNRIQKQNFYKDTRKNCSRWNFLFCFIYESDGNDKKHPLTSLKRKEGRRVNLSRRVSTPPLLCLGCKVHDTRPSCPYSGAWVGKKIIIGGHRPRLP